MCVFGCRRREEEEEEEEEEGFEVEEVLATHKWRTFRYWKVRWVGGEETWEPNKHISSTQADKLINTYKKNNPDWQNENHDDIEKECEDDYQKMLCDQNS